MCHCFDVSLIAAAKEGGLRKDLCEKCCYNCCSFLKADPYLEEGDEYSCGLEDRVMVGFCPACYWKSFILVKVQCQDNLFLACKKAEKDLRSLHDEVGRCGDGDDLEIFEADAR